MTLLLYFGDFDLFLYTSVCSRTQVSTKRIKNKPEKINSTQCKYGYCSLCLLFLLLNLSSYLGIRDIMLLTISYSQTRHGLWTYIPSTLLFGSRWFCLVRDSLVCVTYFFILCVREKRTEIKLVIYWMFIGVMEIDKEWNK